MIKHIVMWKLKENAEGCTRIENAEKIKASLEALKGRIEQIKSLEVGINVSDSETAFDAVLYSEFESLEHLKQYRSHPEHVKISSFVAKVRESRAVVDYNV